MHSKNRELKDAIADANSDSHSKEKLREKLEYYIFRYNAERCARINLQDAYCALIEVVEQKKKSLLLLLISNSLSIVAIALSLLRLLH